MNEEESNRVSKREELYETEANVVAIEGEMSVGMLTIKYKLRANNYQSSIISTETVDSSVFEDSE
jgi:hypothetical protein